MPVPEATAERSADHQPAANPILDRAGVARTLAAHDPDVARQALIERLQEMRAARLAEDSPEECEVTDSEAVV